MAEAAAKAFVCGHPIAHSRSPVIHRHWLAEYRIAGSYERIDVSPADFPAFLAALPASGFAGGNVTLPHKEQAALRVARLEPAAQLIGAVNTVWVEDGALVGDNTDAYGFAASMDQAAPAWHEGGTATVIGAGGAARAVVHALKQRGLRDIRVVNRTSGRAREIADRFGAGVTPHPWEHRNDLLADCGLLVNTTQLGMHGQLPLDVDPALLPGGAIVADIVYVPLATRLLEDATRCGLRTVGGLGMLLHQAVPGFERWFSRRPVVSDDLRRVVEADLEIAA